MPTSCKPEPCTCKELGCGTQSFELEGKIYQGVLRGKTSAQAHTRKLEARRKENAVGLQSEASIQTSWHTSSGTQTRRTIIRRRSSSTSRLPDQPQFALPRRRSSSVDGLAHKGISSHSTRQRFDSSSYRFQEVYLRHPSCLVAMLKTAHSHIILKSTHNECRQSLHFSKLQLRQALHEVGYVGRSFWDEIPTSLPTLLRQLNLDVLLQSQLCCPECFALNGSPSADPNRQLTCDNMRFLKDPDKPRQNYKEITPRPCNANLYTAEGSKPRRIFHYQSLKEWLAKMMSLPQFEDDIDASLHRTMHPDSSTMRDIWDGKMWKTFQDSAGRPYTLTSGNIVFGLYCDWFNPYGRKSRRKVSTGNLLLICFNLPPELRYKTEYLFLYATIPGPREPQTEEINHLLGPLVDELQDLWRGVYFTSTSKYPGGRLIRVALWPLIADLLGMRKIAGFASHAALNFCSCCALLLADINDLDISQWPQRCDHQHHANEWRDAPNLAEQNGIFKTYGLRYSILSALPYWKPIDFVTIDIMHCVILGILKDHATSFLDILTAGTKLKAMQESNASKGVYDCFDPMSPQQPNEEEDDPDISSSDESHDQSDQEEERHHTISSDECVRESHRATDDSCQESLQGPRQNQAGSSRRPSNPSREYLPRSCKDSSSSHEPLPDPPKFRGARDESSDRNSAGFLKHSSNPTRKSLPRLCKPSSSSASDSPNIDSSVPTAPLRPKRKQAGPSDGSDSTSQSRRADVSSDSESTVRESDATSRPKKRLRRIVPSNAITLTASDLQRLQDSIRKTITPTWMTRLPSKVGMLSSGSLKAAEWLTLYTVYMILATLPDLHDSSDPKRQVMYQSIIYAAEITNQVTSRTFSKEDGQQLQTTIQSFRRHLRTHWPHVSVKPNFHFAQHLPDIANLFGPPAYTTCFGGERANGVLASFSTNRHQLEIDKTMSESFIRRGLFLAVLNQAPTFLDRAEPEVRDQMLERLTGVPAPKWSNYLPLDCATYSTWLTYLNSELKTHYGTFAHFTESFSEDPHLPTLVQTTKRLKIWGKTYAIESVKECNSMIQFHLGGQVHFGKIQSIFRSEAIPKANFFWVKPFVQLDSEDSRKNFYLQHPRLRATMTYEKTSSLVVIDARHVTGHIAAMKNPAGTFGIREASYSIVSLQNISSILNDDGME